MELAQKQMAQDASADNDATQIGQVPASSGQQHPLGVYFKIWILLFVLSAFSYMVDYLQFEGILRWTLIITFMVLKAGFIIAIFMHMMWERMALITAILMPPLVLLFLIACMAIESDYTNGTRVIYGGQENLAQFSYQHPESEAEH